MSVLDDAFAWTSTTRRGMFHVKHRELSMGQSNGEPHSYGWCPMCGAPGISRERRPNGNDTCKSKHVYPSCLAVARPAEAPTTEQRVRMAYSHGVLAGFTGNDDIADSAGLVGGNVLDRAVWQYGVSAGRIAKKDSQCVSATAEQPGMPWL